MASYMRALELLAGRADSVYFPGHGGPVQEPQRYVKALIFHRHWRESEIVQCLRDGIGTIAGMVARIYKGIEPSLSAAAAMAISAQLEYLAEKGSVVTRNPGTPGMDQEFALLE